MRTNLWLVPVAEIALAVGLFAGTHALDRAAYDGSLHYPSFIISGSPDVWRAVFQKASRKRLERPMARDR